MQLAKRPPAGCLARAGASEAAPGWRPADRAPARPSGTPPPGRWTQPGRQRRSSVVARAELRALLFDCDGVILESEELHRLAYNAAFEHFAVRPGGAEAVASWSVDFYDRLQNSIGGGKPKMRWFFGEYGWPTSTISSQAPSSDDEKSALIDELQDWKTQKYQDMIAGGQVEPRPGVLDLFDEAKRGGALLGVCSAATKSSAVVVVSSLLGAERFQGLDVFLAGDDVQHKKPDPSIYKVAATRLGVDPAECLVIEDSTIGLQAAKAAGMRCMVTYTDSTRDQVFDGAERVLHCLVSAGDRLRFDTLRSPVATPVDDRAQQQQ